jgi:hypothetical protein
MRICQIFGAALILQSVAALRAEPHHAFIHPGIARVHPGQALLHPSFNHLIPSSFPVIHPGVPRIYPGERLIHPMERPLAKCNPNQEG